MFQITFNIENKDQGGGNTMDDNLSIIEEELEQLNTSGEAVSDDVDSDSDTMIFI